MAKYNLETRYSVVGLVEHFNTSLAVMEKYLPGKGEKKDPYPPLFINSVIKL